MRKLLLAVGLIAILVWILVQDRIRTGPPAVSAAQPVVLSAALQAESRGTTRPADQLLAAAASTDAAIAWSAYHDLEQIGYCPYIPDSPESPVGMLTAAYGNPASDAERVREAILLLVKQGCDINQYSAVGLTPLHNAVLFRQPELLSFLLEQKADPLLRVIAIPGKSSDRAEANLDAYGLALALRAQYPDDVGLREVIKRLKPTA